jgi:hypothetical protein
VALVFSCVAGALGILVISWYGLGELGEVEKNRETRAIERFANDRGVDDSDKAEEVTVAVAVAVVK